MKKLKISGYNKQKWKKNCKRGTMRKFAKVFSFETIETFDKVVEREAFVWSNDVKFFFCS